MQEIVLGRTGLTPSVAGLGAGGPSRLGLRTGADERSPIEIVRSALDLGITFVDTAPTYGTEEIVGKAIAGRRDEIVLSTKVRPTAREGGERYSAQTVRETIEQSLVNLGTDVIDVLHLHAVALEDYDYSISELLPVLEDFRTAGKVRFLGITEEFSSDLAHATLDRSVADDHFDVMMVGFNLLNPSAAKTLLPQAAAKDVGIEVMYAVRRALSRPEYLREILTDLIADGLVDGDLLDLEDPLGFLVHEAGARSLVDASYRWARHQVPDAVILTGTGNAEHLRANVESIDSGPLPEEAVERLDKLFGHLATHSGE